MSPNVGRLSFANKLGIPAERNEGRALGARPSFRFYRQICLTIATGCLTTPVAVLLPAVVAASSPAAPMAAVAALFQAPLLPVPMALSPIPVVLP